MLPAGYVGMFLVAIFPPIWPRVTGVRVLAHPGGDVSPANIPPRKRAKVLARCPVSAVDEATVAEVVDDPHPVSWRRRCSPLAAPVAATSTRSRPGTSFEGSPRALHGSTFPRMYEARAHECIVVGDDGTVTVLDERSATEHRTELEVSVGSAPRIGAPPAALKAP
ncbi:hypothetical protein GCM10009606_29830 [Nocardioides aquiterrae]|uniref:Uncharacterized protein n=1 Tax=Nocardioides aquiterrae TaxID=203799 RepID=A0ABN1UH61_9ACTN